MAEPAANLPLNALRAFEVAARLGSFKAAGDELSITASAVSHQIAHLEDRLGRQLFVRAAGRVVLSEEGLLLQPFLREAFARMVEGVALVTRRPPAELTVQVYITVAVRWLMPRLHRFQRANPDLVLKFNASHLSWDFDPAAADMGIVLASGDAPRGEHRTPLFEAELVLVCSPALLSGSPPLTAPADVARHQRLQVYTAQEDWRTWCAAAGIPFVPGGAGASFDSYLLVIEAACEGRGVAVVPHFLAANDLRSGRLIQPFSVTAKQPSRWVLACRRELSEDRGVATFRRWLQDEVAADPVITAKLAQTRTGRGRGRRMPVAAQDA
jgi:LysR family glycine cleavage system transcriptional activator